jgi:hypothetical protein
MVLIRVSIVRRKAVIVDFTKAWEITYMEYERVLGHNVVAIEKCSKWWIGRENTSRTTLNVMVPKLITP